MSKKIIPYRFRFFLTARNQPYWIDLPLVPYQWIRNGNNFSQYLLSTHFCPSHHYQPNTGYSDLWTVLWQHPLTFHYPLWEPPIGSKLMPEGSSKNEYLILCLSSENPSLTFHCSEDKDRFLDVVDEDLHGLAPPPAPASLPSWVPSFPEAQQTGLLLVSCICQALICPRDFAHAIFPVRNHFPLFI